MTAFGPLLDALNKLPETHRTVVYDALNMYVERLEQMDFVANPAELKPEDRDRDTDVSALMDLLLFYSRKPEDKPEPAAAATATEGTKP